jgi:predicted dehydrogenase
MTIRELPETFRVAAVSDPLAARQEQAANLGPHVLDLAMTFLGPGDVRLFADLRNGLSSGDAEDHAKVTMKAETGPTVDVEVPSCAALPQDPWLTMGTSGGLSGTARELRWRWVDWSTMPPRPVDRDSTPDRSYNREQLDWKEETWQASADAVPGSRALYEDLYHTLREGAPPAIKAESARRYVAILERCRAEYGPERAAAARGMLREA